MYRSESRAAYESADLASIEERIAAHLASCGDHGSTCDEAIVALHGSHQSISPSFTHMAERGEIVRTMARRRTRSGRAAAVYRLPAAPGLFAPPPARASQLAMLRAVMAGALVARGTGDWGEFDAAIRTLARMDG